MSDDAPATPRADELAPSVRGGASDRAHAAPVRVGRYLIEAEIGAGAMGTVYRARDPELDRVLAIKVIRARRGDSRARLLREAQAMAKVRHPNVVPIFDVGTLDGDTGGDTDAGLFVVMPLVAGGTLRAWMRKGPHPWREVVARFTAAGRGLAAAHAAGLVHRDFKPDNVLVADDGEILVADFGLALAHDAPPPTDTAPSPTLETSTIAGTPAYMAPEQRAGAPLDARSDQFSFCIAFWEGLFGERPGDARTRTVARSPLAKRSALRADGDAPTWLKAALERGLSADPAKRWPTIDALLDHLRARLQRPRRLAIAAAIAVPAIVAVTFAIVTRSPAVDPCAGAGEPVAKVWTPARRAAISKALRAIDAPYAASVAQYVDDQFEKAARSFTAARVEACTATNIRGEQSPQLLDARINCLDRHLDTLDALAARLEHLDRKMLNRAAQATDDIDDIAECSRVVTLGALPPLPTDPAARATIREIQRRLIDIDAESRLAPPSPAILERSKATLTAARATGRCPLITDGLWRYGSVLVQAASNRDELIAARAVLRDASIMADSCGADDARANSLIRLADTAGQVGATAAEQAAAWEAASAVMVRVDDPRRRAHLAFMRAEAALKQQHLSESVALANRALEVLRASPDPHEPGPLLNLGRILHEGGDAEHAEVLVQEAYDEVRRRYGPAHPETANAAQILAGVRVDRGDSAGAMALLEEVLKIQRGAYGPDHRRVLITLVNLSAMRAQMGERIQARKDLEAALPSIERVFGAAHPLLAAALDGLVIACDDDPPTAIAYGRRAVAISVAASGDDSDDATVRRINLAGVLTRGSHTAEAVQLLRRVLLRDERQLTPDAPRIDRDRVGLARALVGSKSPREALPLLDQARAGFAKAGDAPHVADTDLALADAHLALGDRKAADASIAAVLAAFPDAKDPKHAAALAWQAKHPR
ncbi:MAG: serine/threonine-protein kinase [Deltaproteobacteria bacterium]|nr:serine/threonine-protein kinase [Deltaproteobacteria bacterium]